MSSFVHRTVRFVAALAAAVLVVLVTVLWGWQEHEERTVKAVQSTLDDHATSLVLGIVNQDEATVAAVNALSKNNSFGEALLNGNEPLLTAWIQSFVEVGGFRGIGVKGSSPNNFWAVGSLTSDARALLDDSQINSKDGYTNGNSLLTAYESTVMLDVSESVSAVVGSVVVEANLNNYVPLTHTENGAVVTAVHSDGTVLSSGSTTPFPQVDLTEEVKTVISSQRPAAFTYTDKNDHIVVAVFRPVPTREYGILVEVPHETIFLEKGAYRYLLGVGAVILLILGAWFGNIFKKYE